MATTDAPGTTKKIGTRDKDVPWYHETMDDQQLGPAFRELLENYSHIPPEEVEKHIYTMRDEAWSIWLYPCIGQFRFLDLGITLSPHYQTILSRLKDTPGSSSEGPEIFLDLGCCFGQDLRKLVYDGAPEQNLYACDLRADFFKLGYKLFRDGDRLKSTFVTGDVFDRSPEAALTKLEGKIDVLYAGSLIHLFDYDEQVLVCERIAALLKPKKGSVVLGRQVGAVKASERIHRTNPKEKMYRHDAESFEQMWKEVGEKTGSTWRVEVDLSNSSDLVPDKWSELLEGGMRRVRFTVWRSEGGEG